MTETPLRERLRKALPAAMKARDKAAVSALRATLSALDNAEAVAPAAEQLRGQAIEEAPTGAGATEVARQVLSEDDRAEQLSTEAAVLRGHLVSA